MVHRACDSLGVSETPAAGDAFAYRLTLRYDGREFFGWQRHPGKATVQGALEAAIEEVFGVQRAAHASGRTDRGVHADAQVVHVHVPFEFEPAELIEALNEQLPDAVVIFEAAAVPISFHARDDATAKTYRYEIYNAPDCPEDLQGRVWHIPGALDVDAMRSALDVLSGAHDFTSFAKKANYKRKSMVRTLDAIDLQVEGPHIVMRFRADGFLYKMVRNLVRALVKVGEGRSNPEKLRSILEARDRSAAPGTAPPTGLFLESVEYDEGEPSA